MQPYFDDGQITIYHADCREVLPTLEPVDLVLTDVPYSSKTHAGARGDGHLGGAKVLVNFDSWTASEIRAVFGITQVRRWLISFMDWRHVAALETEPPAGLRFVRFGIWNKPNGMPQFSGDRPATGWEAVAMFHPPTKMHWNGGGHRAVWTVPKIEGQHPTQKPPQLIRTILAQFADPSDVILDFCCGAGTTLRAAKDMGLRAIGVEIKEEYCELAASNMAQSVLNFTDGLAV